MKKIGIFICTYNSEKYIKNCITSLFNQSKLNADIFVIDNASSDNTVQIVNDSFKEKVNVFVNPENLGGSGGFAKGIQLGLELGYQYLMLLDNDITLSENTIENMEKFLDDNEDTAIVGAKICSMDCPSKIQDFGSWLSFKTYEVFVNKIDDGKNKECDYVASCALLARSDVIRKVGGFPTENFIYYDDIEFCWRIKLAGYKIYCLADTLCLHKNGEVSNTNSSTLSRYYRQRNRLNFFAKFIDEQEIDLFCNTILKEYYNMFYFCYLKGYYKILESYLHAYNDFLNNVRGKTTDDKIYYNVPDNNVRLFNLIKKDNNFIINIKKTELKENYYYFCEAIRNLAIGIKKSCKNLNKIYIVIPDFIEKKDITVDLLQKEFMLYKIDDIWPYIEFLNSEIDLRNLPTNVKKFLMIYHVSEADKDISPAIYIDASSNIIQDSAEFNKLQSWKNCLPTLIEINKIIMKNKIIQLRKANK